MTGQGVPPDRLTDADLDRELYSLHRTRDDTLRHGPDTALAQHNRRTAELEAEYLRRHPHREVTRGVGSSARRGARPTTGQLP